MDVIRKAIAATFLLAVFSLSSIADAALFSIGFDTYNTPYLNAVNYLSDARPMTSLITGGGLSYEGADGTGALNISSSSAIYGDMEINAANITTNDDGSLHVNGTMNFLTLGSSASFFGDMAITAGWDDSGSVTMFDLGPIAFVGSNHDGLLMLDGPFAGHLLEFHVTSSLLAIVDNPFPMYSPVPIPPAVWLLSSGLIGLAGLARRRKT